MFEAERWPSPVGIEEYVKACGCICCVKQNRAYDQNGQQKIGYFGVVSPHAADTAFVLLLRSDRRAWLRQSCSAVECGSRALQAAWEQTRAARAGATLAAD